MDLYKIINELVAERDRIVRIIESLELMDSGGQAAPRLTKKRGRKFMDGPARKEVSERMKRYWAKRRKEGEVGKKESGAPRLPPEKP